MFTYGYIREAIMAHLDTDEEEAQAMKILSRFHIFANEAMQAICASKPMYKYIDITVVEKFAPLVMDGASFRLATDEEINWDVNVDGPRPFKMATEAQTIDYYHSNNIYEVGEKINMSDTFIAFANKKAWKITERKPSVSEQLEAEAFGKTIKTITEKMPALIDGDFSYISKNQLKVYKPGKYLIPGRFLWYRFDSGISDEEELDMPSDILLTIPLYVASICLQIDNLQKAQIVRNEFEMALARCTSTDFMTLNDVPSDW